MQKLIFNERLKMFICNDVGEIVKIVPDDSGQLYSRIASIVAKNKYASNNEITIYCDTKMPIAKTSGWCEFLWEKENNAEIKKLPYDIKNGIEIEINPKIDYILPPQNIPFQYLYDVVCTDPRLRYILITTFYSDIAKSKKIIDKYNNKIPTKEEAMQYLKKNKYHWEPATLEESAKRITNEKFDYYYRYEE